MIDAQIIRENPRAIKKMMERRGLDSMVVDEFISADNEHRAVKRELDLINQLINLHTERQRLLKQVNEILK